MKKQRAKSPDAFARYLKIWEPMSSAPTDGRWIELDDGRFFRARCQRLAGGGFGFFTETGEIIDWATRWRPV